MPVIIPAGALRAGDRVMAAPDGGSAAMPVVIRVIETGPHGHIAHLDGVASPSATPTRTWPSGSMPPDSRPDRVRAGPGPPCSLLTGARTSGEVLPGQQPGSESRIRAGIDPEQAVDTEYLEDAQDGGRRDDEPQLSVTGGGRGLSGQQDTDGGGVGERGGGHIGDDDGRARQEGGLQLVADVLGIADVDLRRKRDDNGRRQPGRVAAGI